MSKEGPQLGPGEPVCQDVRRVCLVEALNAITRPAQRFFQPARIQAPGNLKPVGRRLEISIANTLSGLSNRPTDDAQPADDVSPGGGCRQGEENPELAA